MALEESFITLIINHARIEQLSTHALDSRQPGRQLQALKDILSLVQEDETALEEARKAHLAPALTKVLAKATDDAVLDATSSLISFLTGATLHRERLLTVTYPEVGEVAIQECSLSEGVGARLWGISHSFNKYLISHRNAFKGNSVLEIGSGVGSTGVVAAKLDPLSVTVTDLTAPLLQNLRATVLKNCRPPSSASSHPSQPSQNGLSHPTPATIPTSEHPHSQPPDLQFSDAESVSDEAELFAADSGSDGAGELRDSQDGHTVEAAEAGEEWDVGVVSVRAMDWKHEWDLWAAEHGVAGDCGGSPGREDDTTSALDSAPTQLASQPPASAPAGATAAAPENGAAAAARAAPHSRGPGVEPPRDTFDMPGDAEGLPPAVPEGVQFGVVLGCEVLYELPHAAWVAATVARRLEAGGTAWIAGAVRDLAVYEAFEEHLSRCGLVFTCTPISPSDGYQGLGNKEDIYEGGYRFYSIHHKS